MRTLATRQNVQRWSCLLASLFVMLGLAHAQSSTSSVTTDLVSLTKSAPDMVAIGETFEVIYRVEARQGVGNVVVTDAVPEGAKVERSEPQAATQGGNLSWKVDQMAAGEVKEMKLWLTPTGTGTIASCATVSAEPRACVNTVVGQPVLEIAKTGPAQALLNEQVKYQITVRNTGDIAARNVVVTDMVPEGMTHSTNQTELTHEVGTLEPGQSKSLLVELTAAQRGEHCNKAMVTSSNAAEADATACTTVVDRQLEVTKSGTDRQFIGKNASYRIAVKNPGDLDLTNVVVTDTAPAGTRIVSAEGATVEGNQATWRMPVLKAGATETLSLVLTSREPGTRTNQVAVNTAEGLSGKSSAPTIWEGYPALLIEVIDTNDPLQPGEETTYIITVTNQGTASDRNVKIVANFPAEITPISATGDSQATINGNVVEMAPYDEIQPKEAITWRVQAKAQQAGDSRLRVNLTSRLLQKAVTEEESTQVY